MKKLHILLAVLLTMSLLLCGCSDDDMSMEEAAEANPLSLGVVDENGYENKYMGIAFAPEGWELAGADELQDALAESAELLEGTELEEKLADADQVMAMQGVSPDGMANVNIIYTKLDTTERLANLVVDDEAVVDEILNQKDTLIESYASAGLEIEDIIKAEFNYCGEQRLGTLSYGSVTGVPCYILQLYERNLGSYTAAITVTSFQEDTTESVYELFESLNP